MGIAIAGTRHGILEHFRHFAIAGELEDIFEFVLKGSDKLGYKEHLDYDLVESSNPAFGKSIVRINVTRNHRQTIQYILPLFSAKKRGRELLVIDEAAAIPLPTVKALLGPYLVFLCSTINGYEGRRALSIKLIGNLEGKHASSFFRGNKVGMERITNRTTIVLKRRKWSIAPRGATLRPM